MKKSVIKSLGVKIFKTILILMIIIHSNCFAQNIHNAQEDLPPAAPPFRCAKKGDFIIDGYYGYPYLNSVLLEDNLSFNGQYPLYGVNNQAYGVYNSINIINEHNYETPGVKFEYMITNKIGLGMEGTYSLATISYASYTGNIINTSISKTRILGKLNFHFASGKNIDHYFSLGLGYKNVDINTSELSAYSGMNVTAGVNTSNIPVSVRMAYGVRYFFTKRVGLNAEVGLGGPIIQAGLSFKISKSKDFEQDTLEKSEVPFLSNRCVKKGDIIIDGFYGYPNLLINKKLYTDQKNYEVFGAKFEYMVSNKIGLGMEGTYSLLTFNHTVYSNYTYNNASYMGYYANITTYTERLSQTRILGKINFHFATSKTMDPYFTLGAGYKNIELYPVQPNPNQPGFLTTYSIDPNFTNFPFAVRISLGFHYFFSKHIGLNAEAGIGGPLVQAGLSFKM